MKAPGKDTLKQPWALALVWANVAVVVVDLLVVTLGLVPTFRSFFHLVVFTFAFSNLTSILGMFVLGWLFRRLPPRRLAQWPVLVPGILIFAALACLAAQAAVIVMDGTGAQSFWPGYLEMLRFALPLALVFGLGAMTYASLQTRVSVMEQALHKKEIAEEKARKLAAEARLRSLESWIHPHFLFNTLNSISALIALDPKKAEQTVGRLATLLRASLDTSDHSLIALGQEMAMVESYVEIERVRLGSKLRGHVDLPVEFHDVKVPPMSLQSLVENAVKHGIAPQSGGGEFWVTAAADPEGSVRLRVRNTGPAFDLSDLPAGHGLDKLVQRLETLFGDRASLHIFREDDYSVVEMVLPRV